MSSIPTGTVTFLFTNIEGSTKRWERQPRAMTGAGTFLFSLSALLRKVSYIFDPDVGS
jgi:hypothetical protein